MPTRELKRIWCKTCNEFELHGQNYPNWEDWFCKECETGYTEIKLKAIPKEKILEQRERYKKWKKEEYHDMFQYMMTRGGLDLMSMFEEPGDTVKIFESDAGQKEIDKIEKEKRDKKYEERRIKREEEKTEMKKFRKLGRNDLCLCGSNKKFKHCCWKRIQSYG